MSFTFFFLFLGCQLGVRQVHDNLVHDGVESLTQTYKCKTLQRRVLFGLAWKCW